MTVAWPVSVNTIQHNTITLTTRDQRTLWGADLGSPLAEALASASQVIITFDVIFTGSELVAFQTWFESQCGLGAVDFSGLEGVVSDFSARYKFEELPSFIMIRSGPSNTRLWRSTFVLLRVD